MSTANTLVSVKGPSPDWTRGPSPDCTRGAAEPRSLLDRPFSLGFPAFCYQNRHEPENRCLRLPLLPVDSQVGLPHVLRETEGLLRGAN